MTEAKLAAFTSLDDDCKIMLIQMGIESFMRAWTLDACGLTTLKGATSYIASDSGALCDLMLHALNGSEAHREVCHEFLQQERCSRIALAFHPAGTVYGLSDLFKEPQRGHKGREE